MAKQIFDISPTVSESSPIFPGDTAFERQVVCDFTTTEHMEVGWIKSSHHIGAHVDAPNHYSPNGTGIDEVLLATYIGDCQVVFCPGNRSIQLKDINVDQIVAPRVLFKTNSFLHDQPFQNHFATISAEVILALFKKNVLLVGIDTPSLDPADSKTLDAHKAIAKCKMAILEGIDLSKVEAGTYELIALPLKLKKADASMVRAILRR